MPFITDDPEVTPEELQPLQAVKVRPGTQKSRSPFITDDPEVMPFITDDLEVSPEELQTTEAVKARLEAQKSRLDPMAYVKGAVQGVSDFAEQVQGSQKELGARVAARGVPQTLGDAASLGLSAFGGQGSLTANIAGRALGEDLPKVAFEAALRGASDLGQIGKDVAQSQVLDPYRVLRQAVQDEGFIPATKKVLANAPQLLGPGVDKTATLLQVFPKQAAEILRQAHQRAAQQAQDREALQKGDRSQLGEVATALASQFTEDPLLAEEIGKAVSPSKDLAQTTDLASNLADPSVLESRLVKLGTRIGSRVAPTLTKQMSTPILELGGKAAKVAAAKDAKGRLAKMVGNNKQAWEEAVQRSDVSAPPLQTPPRQLFAPSEVQQAKQLFSERAAQAGQKSPGLVQKGVGAAGQVAEKGGKAVENVTGKIDELAEKYEGPLSLASTVAGASGGTLGALAGSQLPGAVRKVAKWSQNASRAGTALRSIANTDWGSSIPIWRQIAKDPDAPQWLVRGVTVNVAGKLKAGELVENSLRVGGDLGKGLLEGAATDAVLTAADTSKSGEEIGGEAGTGGLFGVLGTAPALKSMSNQRKALAFSYDSMRKASESIAAGADPLVIAATPDATMHSSVILEQMFRGVLPGRKDLKVDLMDGAQFTQVSNDPAAAAFYDETTGHIAVNLESVDADGRQLHEAGHALMASLAASNPAIIQHFRQLLGADGLSRARQDYQQALGRSVPEDDTFIVGELFSEALANGLRGANLNEALPAVLGRTQTQSFFRDLDVRRALKDPATLDLVRQQFQSAAEFRPAVDMEKEPGVRLRAAQAGNHPALPTETRTDGTQGNDFVDVTNGQVRETPVPVVRARVRNRRREVLALFPDVPPSGNTNPQASNVGVREGPSGLNEKTGNRLGDQFYATARSFGEGTKNMLRRVEQAIANNETLAGWYQQIGQGDGWAASVRESLGAVEAQYKDFIPFAFKVDKQGNLLVQNYSLTALERKANQWAGRKGLLSLDLWNGDLGTFRQDVQTYLKNHAEGRPGSDGLGENKRNLINVFLVGGNRTFEALNPLRVQAQGRDRQGIVRSYRADRLQTVEPSDVGGFVKPDYNKQVRNLSPQTETPQFKRWFAASKVADAAGAPMRMYHGTSKDKPFSAFSESPRGIWFSSDPEEASSYARSNDSQKIVNEGGRYKSVNTSEQVIPVYLSLQNPLKVSGEVLKKWQSATNYRAVNRELVANAKQAGYDGLQFGDSTYVAFAPTQIKSAIGNRGTFDASKKDLTLSPKVDAISPDVRNRAVNINDEGADFTGMILRGEKTIETRDTPRSLRPFVGKRVGLVSTGKKGPAQLVGSAVVGEPKFYRTEAEFRADFDLHRVEPGSEYDIGPNGKWGYPLSEVRSLDPQPAPPGGRVARILPEGTRLSPEVQQDSEASTNPLSTPKVGETGQTQLDSPAQQAYSKPAGKGDTYGQEQPEQGRDRGRRVPRGSYAPLEGAPNVTGATGPTPELLDVARSYAAAAGIPHRRQAVYVEVDDDRGRRIAEAYAEMKHAPRDPKVQEAYADLIRQTKDQYQALVKAGYEFTFFDQHSDPYQGNPMAAMRDLRANKRMAVYGTYDGYGTEGITGAAIQDNPMLEPTGLTWFDQQGVPQAVVANDLFRAVHDAFGHGLEGAGFRARGEENAWQAHIRLFTGPARHALTSETRGQNSWLNYGPHGDLNSTAKLKDTIFAEQKTGLMPDWTLTEGVSPDEVDETDDRRYSPQRIQRDVGRNRDFAKPPSESEAIEALHINKRSFWRGHDDLPEGTAVGVRIDIPAFTDNGVYVQTIHEAATPGNVGERIGYDTNVRLAGPVRFFVKQGSEQLKSGALAIKEGRAKKHPIATVEGNLSKDRSVPLDIEEWTPIGMDPKKHSYFYDKRTGQPVEGGSESYSVGNTVFVKDPIPAEPKGFRYSPEPVKLDPKTALQINSYNHAQQLFDRGYTLYGANNDGFDDSPNLIRTAEDIDNYDPENMVAMVPKSGDPVRNSPSVVSQEQLELNFKAAVDQLGTEAALDPAQAPGKPAKKDAPTTFSITISRIKRLLTRGPVNPVGMSAATPKDRHAIAALFRNPAFESQRWVFLKEGKVVAVSSTTVRQPNMVYTFNPYLSIDALAATAEESGADSLFWTHNHPSGISRPSEADIRGTKIIQEKFLKGPIWDEVSFLGHIVTNHNAHHLIKPNGDIELVQVTAFHDKLLNKSIWDAPIYGPESMATAGAAMANRYNPSRMILFLDAPGYIKAVGEISPNLDAKKFAREVKKFALANGATAAVAYGSFIETDLPVFYQLVQDGILIDGYIPGVGSLRNSLQEPPPALYTAPDSMFSENQTVRRSTEKMQFSPRIEQSVDALDKLGDKNLSQVNAKTLKYPNNPAYPQSIALPARWGLVNEKIVGMPKTSKEVSDIVVRQVDRLERVIQDMPEFAKESARFYLDMGLSALDLATAALPGSKGLEQHKMADLMLRFIALGSPRTGVAANATKSAYSISAAASNFTPGWKIGFGPQQLGAKAAMQSWKNDEPFDLNMSGIDNKVRNFYLNGISEIIDLALVNGDTASYDHLMNKVAGSLGLLQPGATLTKTEYPEVKRLLDGMATVDMWDMAAKGFAWPGYLIDPATRNEVTKPWQWSQDKFAQDTTIEDPRWPQICIDLTKFEKRTINGPEDLRYQQARALRIEGNKDWSKKTWEARLASGEPFTPQTSITIFTEGSEAGLSPGGAGPQYDAQQSIDGLISDEINSRGLAPLFGKEKLFARNAQEILWALERLDNPVKANNELVLFGDTFKAVKNALEARQLGERMSKGDRGEAVLKTMQRAYEEMARQDLPIEVVTSGTSPNAQRIQTKIADLTAAGVQNAELVVTEAVAAGMIEDITAAAEKHELDIVLDSVRTGLGGYSENGRASQAPNMVLSLRGNPSQVRQVLEVLSRSMDQDGGNVFRRPSILELNDPKVTLNTVITFGTEKLTADEQWAFFQELNALKNEQGKSFLLGFTQIGKNMAIGDHFYSGDMAAVVEQKVAQIRQIMRKHGVAAMTTDQLLVNTFKRETPEAKNYAQNAFVRDLTARIHKRIDAAAPEQRQFPVVRDTQAHIERLTREAVYLRFGGKSAATAYFVDLASQVDVAILRDQISEEVGATLKKTIDRLAARKIAQGAQKAAKTREERVQVKQEAARSKAEKKALQQ